MALIKNSYTDQQLKSKQKEYEKFFLIKEVQNSLNITQIYVLVNFKAKKNNVIKLYSPDKKSL